MVDLRRGFQLGTAGLRLLGEVYCKDSDGGCGGILG